MSASDGPTDPGTTTSPDVATPEVPSAWPEEAPPPTDRPMGRADLHIHTLASDGVSGVDDVLAAAVAGELDVIAITDHERIDAALVAQRTAQERRTAARGHRGRGDHHRNGHLVGLFMTRRVRPWGTMRDAVAAGP